MSALISKLIQMETCWVGLKAICWEQFPFLRGATPIDHNHRRSIHLKIPVRPQFVTTKFSILLLFQFKHPRSLAMCYVHIVMYIYAMCACAMCMYAMLFFIQRVFYVLWMQCKDTEDPGDSGSLMFDVFPGNICSQIFGNSWCFS